MKDWRFFDDGRSESSRLFCEFGLSSANKVTENMEISVSLRIWFSFVTPGLTEEMEMEFGAFSTDGWKESESSGVLVIACLIASVFR